MNTTKCNCGRSIYQKPNSTIKEVFCPSCKLARLTRQDNPKSIKTGKTGKLPGDIKKTRKKGLKSNFDFYKTTAWNWCRKYVLLYYSQSGYVRCATSGKILRLNTPDCHCGHYIKVRDGNSTNYATAFDFRNLAPQSRQDNTYMGGRQDIMRSWLVERHGEDAIKDLELKRRTICRMDQAELDKWSDHFRELFNKLLIERNISDPWKAKNNSKKISNISK